jgi:CheY-like chemotaxis protein
MGRILVVDDDAPIRRLVGALLRRNGHSVEEAVDGEEGIEKIRAEGYDAVLLDLMMPRMDGFEVLRVMHREGLQATRVIIMSAAAPATINAADMHAVRVIIRKPFDVSVLLDAVAAALDPPPPS